MVRFTRREFVKLTGAGLGAVYLGGCASIFSNSSIQSEDRQPSGIPNFGPIDRSLGDIAPAVFSGDQPDLPHHVLWNKKSFISSQPGGIPSPSEEVEIAIVGAGVSGLSSAYFLRDRNPLVLEQASRFGGNAKGESWRGLDYSIGAAYFTLPKKGTPVFEFFRELGVDQILTYPKPEDPIYIHGKKYENYWENGTSPENRAQFNLIQNYLISVASEKNGEIFPEIPTTDSKIRKRVNELDRISFRAQLEKVAKGPLNPHLLKVIENYCWSAFAASSSEVSAAAGLNFYAGDFDGIAVAPGGNAAVAEAILKALYEEHGPKRLRPSSLVFDVQVVDGGVNIAYVNQARKIETVRAKYAILSCPKFVVSKLIPDLELERQEVIQSLKYRAYLVGNLLVRKGVPRTFYDIEFFNDVDDPPSISDISYGSRPDESRTVFTLYRSLPYDRGRAEVYQKNSYSKFRKEFEEQIKNDVLPTLNLTPKDVVDLRIARWGHPLPVPSLGNYADGKVDWLRKPFKDRVYFVEQDNWTLPAFEIAFHEARHWTNELRKRLT